MYFCAFPQFTYSISKYLERIFTFSMFICVSSVEKHPFIYIYTYLDINVFNFSMTNIPLHDPRIACQKKLITFFFLNSYFWETIFFFHYFTHLYLSFRYNINRKWNGDINILIDVRYKKFISIWKVWWIYLNKKSSILHCSIKLINPFETDHMCRANFDSPYAPYNGIENFATRDVPFSFFTNKISKIKIHPMLQSHQPETDI